MTLKSAEYEQLQQQRMKEEAILNSIRQSNKQEKPYEYSEEQMLKAQEQPAKREINELYNNKITPTYNGILYIVFYVFSLIIIPLLYVNQDKFKMGIAFVACGLFCVIAIAIRLAEKKFQEDMHRESKLVTKINKFSNETSVFCYMLTAFGYTIEFLPPFYFWFIYGALSVVTIGFLLVKPRKD